jgi:hypothetical protein
MSTISKLLAAPPDNFSTTVNGTVTAADLSWTLNSVAGLATEGIGVLFQKDTSGDVDQTTIEFVHWTGIAGAVMSLTDISDRGLTGSANGAQSHTGTVYFEVWVTGQYYYKGLKDSLVNVVDATTGAVDTTKVVTPSGTQTLTNKTLTAPTVTSLAATSPKITTDISDTNGNEILKITATGSAVNEITVANAATGNNPTWSVSGGDTNIGWDIKTKGTGVFRVKQTCEIQVVAAGTDTATGDSKFFFRVPAELNGMNLVGVAACVATAGTTGTTDIQIHRVRSAASVDMLSTKMTIDSGEVDTSTAATPAVINTSNDDVATGDQIHVDVDAVSTTAAKGLGAELQFSLP